MKITQTNQFKKDFKKQIRRGKDRIRLFEVLEILGEQGELPANYKDHALRGNWGGRRDCHVEPDWVLIYQILDDEIILERTGTHSDLF